LGNNYEINYGITRNYLENTLGICHWELVGTWWEKHNPKINKHSSPLGNMMGAYQLVFIG
jgi:hypothetical protein